jgi:hypothetical protein
MCEGFLDQANLGRGEVFHNSTVMP